MAEVNDIQDYSFLDEVLSKSLESFKSKLFGNYDEKTGYFEEAEDEVVNDAVSDVVNEGVVEGATDESEMTEEEQYNDVFDEQGWPTVPMAQRHVAPGDPVDKKPSKFQKFATYQEGKNALLNQLKIYQEGRSKTGIKPTSTLLQAMSIYAPASDNNDPNNYANFIAKKLGIDVNTPISKVDRAKWADAIEIMEGNKGTNPGNLKKFKHGGSPVARTRQQQVVGLNDPELDHLYMPLEGINPIRGLDSGQPVYVQDQTGDERVLYGPDDIAYMNGPVYEKRMQTGGDITEDVLFLDNWYQNRQVQNPQLQKLIEKERKYRIENLYKPYTVSNKPEDIGEGHLASYTTGKRQFNIPENADPGTTLHETTHMSDDFRRPTYGFEERAIQKSLPTKKQVQDEYGFGKRNKEDARDVYDYMSDPGEIKARLMNLRRKAGFRPEQNVTEDDLIKFFDEHEGEADQNIDELLDFIRAGGKKDFNKKVLNLLNNTVSTKRPDSNLA